MRALDASERSNRAAAAKSVAPDAHKDGPGRKRQRGALQDRVARALQHALMVGQFVPGQTMSLRQLALGLGTSPMPVREAINQLTAAGVLETLPNRSVAVPRMTQAQFVELTRIRVALEGMAAEMACKCAPPQLARRLERINAELLKAIRDRDNLASLAKNQEFHFTLYAASESTLLPRLIESLWLRAGPFMYFSLTSPTTLSSSPAPVPILRRWG